MPTVDETVTVSFTRDERLPVTRDGRDYLLHYTYVASRLVGEPAEAAETKAGRVLIGISRTLMSIWGIDGEDLRKVLFEYGTRHVKAKAAERSLGGQSELQITTASAPNRCPYDPSHKKVPDTFFFVSDGFCERRISLLGRCASAGTTCMSTRSANHTECPDGGDGFRSRPHDGPIAKNWNRSCGKSPG